MKHINTIYKEIEKVNNIIEDCYSYLKRNTQRNQERIKGLLDRAVKLRDHYMSKLRKVATPNMSPEISENIEYQVQEHFGRLNGF